jgi:hypothetical protein
MKNIAVVLVAWSLGGCSFDPKLPVDAQIADGGTDAAAAGKDGAGDGPVKASDGPAMASDGSPLDGGGCACASTEYCELGRCHERLETGASCGSDLQCTGGHCVDSVCCDSACDRGCESCKLAGKLGTCSPRPAGDVCRAVSCTGATLSAQASCDGSNPLCPTGATTTCAAYRCQGAACATTCATTADCNDQFYCATELTCQPLKADGTACAKDGECLSAKCTAFYHDGDGDHFGEDAVVASFCGTSPPASYAAAGGDCCDLDPMAKPGVTDFFDHTNGCGTWEYNCDTTVDQEVTVTCQLESINGMIIRLGRSGWCNVVPACGQLDTSCTYHRLSVGGGPSGCVGPADGMPNKQRCH